MSRYNEGYQRTPGQKRVPLRKRMRFALLFTLAMVWLTFLPPALIGGDTALFIIGFVGGLLGVLAMFIHWRLRPDHWGKKGMEW